jgi:hypothetical protein
MKYLKTKSQMKKMVGEQVAIYWNLHKRCWSVTHKGLVIYHTQRLSLDEVTFKVSQKGRERVIKEQKKNVHAKVWGKLYSVDDHFAFIGLTEIRYNPYKYPQFRTCPDIPVSPVSVFEADSVRMVNGKVFAKLK